MQQRPEKVRQPTQTTMQGTPPLPKMKRPNQASKPKISQKSEIRIRNDLEEVDSVIVGIQE